MITTLFSIAATITIYIFSRYISGKISSPFTSPVILSTILLIIIFSSLGISYEDYYITKETITYFLGPATVALAVPIYKQRHLLKRFLVPALFGLVVGTIATIGSAIILAYIFNLSDLLTTSLSLKSITIPVASEVAEIIAADELLVAAFVMITGMLGALIGPILMTFFKINSPFARGLAMGTIAHGIGTAEILKEGELQGAVSAVAMGLTAMFSAILIPLIFMFL